MPYVFPKHRLEANTPMDYEEVNENFQDLIGEASGGLNEHNFNSNTFTQGVAISSVEPMACWWDVNVTMDPAVNVGYVVEVGASSGSEPSLTTDNPDYFYQRGQGTWEVIAGLTKEITATGGLYWLLASLQHDGRTKYIVDPEFFLNHYGALYAIRINGRIVYETVTGGVHNNPIIAQGSVRDGEGVFDAKVKITNTGEKVYDTHAIHGDTGLLPISLDFIVDLPPGTHTIDVVMQTLPHPQAGNVSVSTRELIILEMRA